jgi:Cu(I)/Ag(I) efflux system periplasmic protein CusF
MKNLTIAAALLALATTAMAADAINGEVKKIDESTGKITLKHGPAKSLGMAGYTVTKMQKK